MTKTILSLCLGLMISFVSNACPTAINAVQQSCGNYVFHLSDTPVGNVTWNFGDGANTTGGIEIEHSYIENGLYVVTAMFSGPECPQTLTLSATVEVNCGIVNECPSEIWSGAGTECGVMNFEIGSFVEGENVMWFPGDDTGAVQGGHFFSHTYASSGTYDVCAFYTTPLCPNGVELCTTIIVESCNENLCPTGIVAEAIDCNTFMLHVQGIDNADVAWDFGDGTSANGGINADHTWLENGVYIVTAEIHAPQCPIVPPSEIITLVFTVHIECATEVECPSEIWSSAGTECGVMNFEIGSFVEGENVMWFPGDDTGAVQGGHFFSHTYAAPGNYDVCAFYTTPLCPNGVELCTTITVTSCNENLCPTGITAEAFDCDTYALHVQGIDNADVAWDFGDGTSTNGGINADHTWLENGVYIVTAEINAPQCPIVPPSEIITLVLTVHIECATEVECPSEIWSGAGTECGVMNFEIGSFVEGENVMWFPGDDTGAVQGGHFFSHTYASSGTYDVCAFYTTPLCPNGVELCTTIIVESCNENLCPTGIVAEAIDCNTFILHVQGIDNADVAWDFGDGTSANGGINADHTWLEDGVYIVTAEINAPQCPIMPPSEIITLVFTVHIECATEVECPTEMWSSAGTECGVMNFEIGSFVEGENVMWFPGDETGAVEGGHFFSHTYAFPGSYTVCAFYTTPLCPNGVELCTVIEVAPCEQPCNEIGFGIDSYLLEGGTPWLTFMISNAESGIVVTSGVAEYTENDPYFDTPLCLPDGCYYLSIDNNNPLHIGQGVNIFFILNSVNLMENATIIYQDEIAITYLIGVNTDCGAPPTCESSFEPVFTATPGHIEFINNSSFSGVVEFLWEYGNGTTSDGPSGNVQYESNGVYNVCLTVTTGNCSNTFCQLLIVDDMETPCEFNELTIVIDANYFEPINELIWLSVSVPFGPVFQSSIETDGIFNDTLSLCIPDGCYEVSMFSELPVQALSIICAVEGLNTQQLGDIQLNIGETTAFAAIGVNMDCTIGLEETTDKAILAFPNPASDNIQFVSNESIERLEIFDMTGKRIASFNPNQPQVQINTSNWSNGLYVAHSMGSKKMERLVFEVNR